VLKSFLLTLVAVISLCAGATQATAATLSWTGDTSAANAPTWHRPSVNSNPGTYLALAGSGQGYFEKGFTVDQTGSYSLNVVATGPGTGGWDNGSTRSILAFLYEVSFDSASPLINQIENGGCGACGTPNWSHVLTAGTQYFVVITGYCGANSQVLECYGPNMMQEGPFSASLTGPGGFSAVPEPAAWAMMLLGFGALGATLRSRRARTGLAAA